MELQCKERVQILEALRESRDETKDVSLKEVSSAAMASTTSLQSQTPSEQSTSGWLGGGTVPPVDYNSISRPTLAPQGRTDLKRPSYTSKSSSRTVVPQAASSSARLSPTPGMDPQSSGGERRTPSPEKRGGMLRTLRTGKERTSSGKMVASLRSKPPAAAKAATQAWGPSSQRPSLEANGSAVSGSTNAATWDPYTRSLVDRPPSRDNPPPIIRKGSDNAILDAPDMASHPVDSHFSERHRLSDHPLPPPSSDYPTSPPLRSTRSYNDSMEDVTMSTSTGQPPPELTVPRSPQPSLQADGARQPPGITTPDLNLPSYRKEYLPPRPSRYTKPPVATPPRRWDHTSAPESAHAASKKPLSPTLPSRPGPPPGIPRKAVGVVAATMQRQRLDDNHPPQMQSAEENSSSGMDSTPRRRARKAKELATGKAVPKSLPSPSETDSDQSDSHNSPNDAWQKRVAETLEHLPKGVDEAAAKQIFNEIVIQGDEVHWDDVAGLDIAKSALKETVVYPFLRPDLFMGLREPARGMLLFGPPGTGKTMLARAVATESHSTFFAISASSLTSKYLGESEKLVRALFAIAKVLAPSIIFVDEIDSLLSSRGGGSEHEATRRIKTEFLIQWSDLAKAAAGRDTSSDKSKKEGDPTRVLVLAATNLPWAIDEAARRRFVRRQYIPLPEDPVRKTQLGNLISHQKHSLSDRDLDRLVRLTNGESTATTAHLTAMLIQTDFSGSDITALAKDAAMGPLRSLGEKLLHMSPEDIRPIEFQDFQASLVNIRPSVSKTGLKEYEDWAREFGERGG